MFWGYPYFWKHPYHPNDPCFDWTEFRPSFWGFFCTPRNKGQTIKQFIWYMYVSVLHPWRLTWNIIPWRFGSNHVPFFSWVMAVVREPAINLPVFVSQVRIHVIFSSCLQAKNLHPNNFQVSNASQIVQVPLGNLFGTDFRCPIQLPLVAHFPN